MNTPTIAAQARTALASTIKLGNAALTDGYTRRAEYDAWENILSALEERLQDVDCATADDDHDESVRDEAEWDPQHPYWDDMRADLALSRADDARKAA